MCIYFCFSACRIIEICLQMWHRSKSCYSDLRDSGLLCLPSARLLQYKKNKVNQKPGLNTEVLQWMVEMADKQDVCEQGRHGFIVFDEMKIQVSQCSFIVHWENKRWLILFCSTSMVSILWWISNILSSKMWRSQYQVWLECWIPNHDTI